MRGFMEEKIFYVYGWYKEDSDELFYIGKGKGKRKDILCKSTRNKYFLNITK